MPSWLEIKQNKGNQDQSTLNDKQWLQTQGWKGGSWLQKAKLLGKRQQGQPTPQAQQAPQLIADQNIKVQTASQVAQNISRINVLDYEEQQIITKIQETGKNPIMHGRQKSAIIDSLQKGLAKIKTERYSLRVQNQYLQGQMTLAQAEHNIAIQTQNVNRGLADANRQTQQAYARSQQTAQDYTEKDIRRAIHPQEQDYYKKQAYAESKLKDSYRRGIDVILPEEQISATQKFYEKYQKQAPQVYQKDYEQYIEQYKKQEKRTDETQKQAVQNAQKYRETQINKDKYWGITDPELLEKAKTVPEEFRKRKNIKNFEMKEKIYLDQLRKAQSNVDIIGLRGLDQLDEKFSVYKSQKYQPQKPEDYPNYENLVPEEKLQIIHNYEERMAEYNKLSKKQKAELGLYRFQRNLEINPEEYGTPIFAYMTVGAIGRLAIPVITEMVGKGLMIKLAYDYAKAIKESDQKIATATEQLAPLIIQEASIRGFKVSKSALNKIQEGTYTSEELSTVMNSLSKQEQAILKKQIQVTGISAKTKVEPVKEPQFQQIENITPKEIKVLKQWSAKYQDQLEFYGSGAYRTYGKVITGKSGDVDTFWKGTEPQRIQAKKELFNALKKANPEGNYKEGSTGVWKNEEHFVEMKYYKDREFSKRLTPTTTPEGTTVMRFEEAHWRSLVGAYERGIKEAKKGKIKDWKNPEENKDLRRWIEATQWKIPKKVEATKDKVFFQNWEKRNNAMMKKAWEEIQTGKSKTQVPKWYESLSIIDKQALNRAINKKLTNLFLNKTGMSKIMIVKDDGYIYNKKTGKKVPYSYTTKTKYGRYDTTKKKDKYGYYNREGKYVYERKIPQYIKVPTQKYPEKIIPKYVKTTPYKQPKRYDYKTTPRTTTTYVPPYAQQTQIQPPIRPPFTLKKERIPTKIRTKTEEEHGHVIAYEPVMWNAKKEYEKYVGRPFRTEEMAISEGATITDLEKYDTFTTRKIIVPKGDISKIRVRSVLNDTKKFKRRGQMFTERKYYKYDKPRERRNIRRHRRTESGFDWQEYVRGSK